jgi:hypothetical protein
MTGPEAVTTKNAYAQRQLTRPLEMTEYIESIRYLFDEEDNYVEAIRELFHEEEEVEERGEPIVEQPHAHKWWEGFKASKSPRIRSKGMET